MMDPMSFFISIHLFNLIRISSNHKPINFTLFRKLADILNFSVKTVSIVLKIQYTYIKYFFFYSLNSSSNNKEKIERHPYE